MPEEQVKKEKGAEKSYELIALYVVVMENPHK